MATYTQSGRAIQVTTPLGTDVLLLESFQGSESISDLFTYRLEMFAEAGQTIAFDKILGQSVTITVLLPDDQERYINGIVSRFAQGSRVEATDTDHDLVRYKAEIVPAFWLLSKLADSRIFQQMSVPDILKEVLGTLNVTYQLQGTYDPRNYCVQYRESAFHFASRLMEEEGIFYFFKHANGSHEMIVADNPSSHPDLENGNQIPFDSREEAEIFDWVKFQGVHPASYTLWDAHFEMPGKNFEVQQATLSQAAAGTVSHKLTAGNTGLDTYDYPGEFAHRYDGIDPSGGDQSSDLQKIFQDNERTTTLRMEEQTAQSTVEIQGKGNARNFVTGYKFQLQKHVNANGTYVITHMEQTVSIAGAYVPHETGSQGDLEYKNSFRCLPIAIPFRPARKTPKPYIRGTQTAVVVGTQGQEIFTDKYGRVKVQFFWDRLGQMDSSSSCWVRVGTLWAGNTWGSIHIPRIGQEVIVAFLEGDPDQPIIVGSVYNAEQMPPYTLPDNMTISGLKTRSSLSGTEDNFNELRFEDKKDEEEVYFHAEKDFNREVENNDTLLVGSENADDGSQTITIYNNRTETIQQGDESLTIEKGNRTETIKEGDDSLTIEKGSRTESIKEGDDSLSLEKGSRTVSIKSDDTLTAEGKQTITITGDQALTVKSGNQSTTVNSGNISTKASAGSITIEAGTGIELKVGGNSIKIDATSITITGVTIKLSGVVQVEGSACTISSGTISLG